VVFWYFFDNAEILPISEVVVNMTINLRQRRNMSLDDALIAGTAIVTKLTLVTANV